MVLPDAQSTTHHRRFQVWNQMSQGARECTADYFSIDGRPKIRVEVTPNQGTSGHVRDHHTTIGNHDGVSSGSQSILGWAMISCVIIFALVALWYTRTRWIRRPVCKQRSETKEPTRDQNVSEVSSLTPTAEQTDETCPKGIPVLLSERSNLIQSDRPSQPADSIRVRGQSESHLSVATRSSLLGGRDVVELAHEVTAATTVALQSFEKAGHSVEAKDLIPSITQLIISSMHRTEKLQQESRRYVFEASQNQLNREEAAALHREDSQWTERLRNSCNDLVEEVERSAIRLVLIEVCGRSALWIQNLIQTTSSLTALASEVAHVICRSCTAQSHTVVMSASLYVSQLTPQSTCWLSCGARCLATILGVYVVLQFRLMLPSVVREVFGTIAFGVFCFVSITMNVIPIYWYCFTLLMAMGYCAAHWQFFATKGTLQRAFPGKNPSSYAVNQAIDALETQRRVYAIVPLAFVAIHTSRLLWLGWIDTVP